MTPPDPNTLDVSSIREIQGSVSNTSNLSISSSHGAQSCCGCFQKDGLGEAGVGVEGHSQEGSTLVAQNGINIYHFTLK